MTQRTSHHGRHSFFGKSQLCSMDHYQEEQVGKFGRMFNNGFSPLYTNPNDLNKLGAKGGPMDGGRKRKLLLTMKNY